MGTGARTGLRGRYCRHERGTGPALPPARSAKPSPHSQASSHAATPTLIPHLHRTLNIPTVMERIVRFASGSNGGLIYLSGVVREVGKSNGGDGFLARLKEQLVAKGRTVVTSDDVSTLVAGSRVALLEHAIRNATVFVPVISALYGNSAAKMSTTEFECAERWSKRMVPIHHSGEYPGFCGCRLRDAQPGDAIARDSAGVSVPMSSTLEKLISLTKGETSAKKASAAAAPSFDGDASGMPKKVHASFSSESALTLLGVCDAVAKAGFTSTFYSGNQNAATWFRVWKAKALDADIIVVVFDDAYRYRFTVPLQMEAEVIQALGDTAVYILNEGASMADLLAYFSNGALQSSGYQDWVDFTTTAPTVNRCTGEPEKETAVKRPVIHPVETPAGASASSAPALVSAPAPAPASVADNEGANLDLGAWLDLIRLGHVLPALNDLGAYCMADLDDLEVEDLRDLAMKKLELRRFEKALAQYKKALPTEAPEPASLRKGSTSRKLLEEVKAMREESKATSSKIEALQTLTLENQTLAIANQKAIEQRFLEVKTGMVELSDNTIPTIFVIVPASNKDPSINGALMDEFQEASECEKEEAREDTKLFDEGREANKHGKKVKKIEKCINYAVRKVEQAQELFSTFEAAISDPAAAIKAKVEQLLEKDEYHMYLVCERCLTRQEDGGPWPYKITKQSERTDRIAAKLIPLAQKGIQVTTAVNTVAAISQLIGVPVPKIPKAVVDQCKDSIEYLSQSSNVEAYSVIEEKLGGDTDPGMPTEKLTGYLQREYARFLEKHDPEKGWAGLSRVVKDDGRAIWYCAECAEEAKSQPGHEIHSR
mmetsp:Transcript_49080/g.138976  ORF Transcript_49080/g.138976 Transcript_49080/m.138976 type:complete len:829 (+) Transcript_49080:968-3454(+)